jgi:hypothetical protein
VIEVGEEKNGGNATQEIRLFSNSQPPALYRETEGVLLKKSVLSRLRNGKLKHVSIFKP